LTALTVGLLYGLHKQADSLTNSAIWRRNKQLCVFEFEYWTKSRTWSGKASSLVHCHC
jgi:hypothetical protein